MAEPFMAEIKLMSFNFAPKGWAQCNGQLLPINQNQALFALLGTAYGGNGQTTFGLPNLRGQVPMHMGRGHSLGETAGSESVTVNNSTMPTHIHQLFATNTDANRSAAPPGNVLGPVNNLYGPASNLTALLPASVTNIGGSQPHENRQPFLVLNFCIALQGIFPSQN
jgi:microcystin-dependent protein